MAEVTRATPPARTPPMESSDEAKANMLRMARKQGDALKEAAEFMMKEEADDGGEAHAGDYLVGYAVESAEGMYHLSNGKLEWQDPTSENCHIEVAVRDAADGRFIPGLKVRLTVLDAQGNEVGTHEQPFLWHPWLYHYGRNWKVPGDGSYTFRVHIEPPTFGRHDRKNGLRFAEPVEVEFTGVQIETGQKKS